MDKLLRGMPMKQFVEWQRYDEMCPFGDLRGDWQAAIVCATIANMMSRRKFEVNDFLLTFKEAKKAAARAPKQSWQEQKFLAQMISAAMTKKDKRRRP